METIDYGPADYPFTSQPPWLVEMDSTGIVTEISDDPRSFAAGNTQKETLSGSTGSMQVDDSAMNHTPPEQTFHSVPPPGKPGEELGRPNLEGLHKMINVGAITVDLNPTL